MADGVFLLPGHLAGGAGVGEGDVGEVFDEGDVQLPEPGELCADDIADFSPVLARAEAGDVEHARVAEVGEAGYALVEFAFGEVLRQHEQRRTQGGEEVDLVREADAGVVPQDFDGFLQAPRQVEGGPFGEVGAEGGEVYHAVFDQHAGDGDVGVEVDARAEGVLDAADGAGVEGEVAEEGVVVGVLG